MDESGEKQFLDQPIEILYKIAKQQSLEGIFVKVKGFYRISKLFCDVFVRILSGLIRAKEKKNCLFLGSHNTTLSLSLSLRINIPSQSNFCFEASLL